MQYQFSSIKMLFNSIKFIKKKFFFVYVSLFYVVISNTTENYGTNLMPKLHIPYVAVRTPSDESNRSISVNSNISGCILSCDTHRHQSLSNIGLSIRKNMKRFVRSSRTVDNITNILINGNNKLMNKSKRTQSYNKLKSFSHSSHSQPIFNQNSSKHESCFSNSFNNTIGSNKSIGSGRLELHLPVGSDCLHRSHSCTDGIIDSTNPSFILNSQANNSEATSLRSSESTVSSLSAYISTQQRLSIQEANKNEINKSEESIFSYSSPTKKEHSIKSLIMAAASNDSNKRQDNDVLLLIASWILRSPEDFQGTQIIRKENYIA